jgi:hypothetical protein
MRERTLINKSGQHLVFAIVQKKRKVSYRNISYLGVLATGNVLWNLAYVQVKLVNMYLKSFE